jgi:hypothetical protein
VINKFIVRKGELINEESTRKGFRLKRRNQKIWSIKSSKESNQLRIDIKIVTTGINN